VVSSGGVALAETPGERGAAPTSPVGQLARAAALPVCGSAALALLILYFSALDGRWVVVFGAGVVLTSVWAFCRFSERPLLFALFLSLPVLAYNFPGKIAEEHLGGPPGFFHTLFDLPLSLLYGVWLAGVALRRASLGHMSKVGLLLLALIGWAGVSLYAAPSPQFGLYELSRLWIMWLGFHYVSNRLKGPADWRAAGAALLAGAFLESVLALLQVWRNETFGLTLIGSGESLGYFVGNSGAVSRAVGTFNDPNAFALYLNLVTPVILALMLLAPVRLLSRLLLCAVFATALVALIVSYSRAGWGALAASTALMLGAGWRRLKVTSATTFGVAATLATILACALLLRGNIRDRLGGEDRGAAYSRVPLMKVALNAIEAHPVAGVGLNNYGLVMQRYDNTPEQIAYTFKTVVHSSYLLVAAETGLVGLGLFLWLSALVCWKGIAVGRRDTRAWSVALRLGLGCACVGFLVHIAVEPIYLGHQLFFVYWAFAGLIVSLADPQAAEETPGISARARRAGPE
jgi:O-antigen ligase